jgi:hypothetical protein
MFITRHLARTPTHSRLVRELEDATAEHYLLWICPPYYWLKDLSFKSWSVRLKCSRQKCRNLKELIDAFEAK